MTDTDLKSVRVRVRQLDYFTKGTDPLGNEVDVIATAYGPGMPQLNPAESGLDPESQEYADRVSDYKRGQLIHVLPKAYIGLIKTGAVQDFQTDEATGEEVEEEEELLDVNAATVDDLADWISQEHPTVNDVVQASGGDPDVARKLLEAETQAQSGEPRKGVVEGLTAVIGRA